MEARNGGITPITSTTANPSHHTAGAPPPSLGDGSRVPAVVRETGIVVVPQPVEPNTAGPSSAPQSGLSDPVNKDHGVSANDHVGFRLIIMDSTLNHIEPGSMEVDTFKHIKEGRLIQKLKAEELCRDARVNLLKGGGITVLYQFQTYLSEYKITVFRERRGDSAACHSVIEICTSASLRAKSSMLKLFVVEDDLWSVKTVGVGSQSRRALITINVPVFAKVTAELSPGMAEYFDSYGFLPRIKSHLVFIRQNTFRTSHSTIQLQSITSDVCGHYCLMYLLYRAQKIPLKYFQRLFSPTNHTGNDAKCQDVCGSKAKPVKPLAIASIFNILFPLDGVNAKRVIVCMSVKNNFTSYV
uniref:Uncharacterized protein n=1 Tax=Timema monikensis TaxID=170555 RepID=A0A7R9HU48_9NEOP|nr:unnamed protein product [Timema monikensis]